MSLSRRRSVRALAKRDPDIVRKLNRPVEAATPAEGAAPVFGVAINVSEPGDG